MSYPTRYYDMQRTVVADIGYATRTGLCPVCKQRKSATWPDGVRRITCGDQKCFQRWLPVRGHLPQPQPTAPSLPDAASAAGRDGEGFSPSPAADRLPQSTRIALGRLWLHVGTHWFLPACTVSDAAGRQWIYAHVGTLFEAQPHPAPYLVRFRPDIARQLAAIQNAHTFYRRNPATIDQMWANLLDSISNL